MKEICSGLRSGKCRILEVTLVFLKDVGSGLEVCRVLGT